MSTTQFPATTTSTTSTTQRQPVWKHGVAAAVVAAVATTALAATASAAGVSFEIDGEAIPLAGFAQLTVVFSLLGVALAAALGRWAKRPRSTFVRTTVALTVLSVVPDVTFGFDAASAVTLVALHTVAAAIVIPALASRLAE